MLIRIEAHQQSWSHVDQEHKHEESYIQNFEIRTAEDIGGVLDWFKLKLQNAHQFGETIVFNVIDVEEKQQASQDDYVPTDEEIRDWFNSYGCDMGDDYEPSDQEILSQYNPKDVAF